MQEVSTIILRIGKIRVTCGLPLALMLALALPNSPIADEAAFPPSSIDDEALLSLGPKSQGLLLEHLKDPSKAQFRAGIVFRLHAVGDISKPNKKITAGLQNFIETLVEQDQEITTGDFSAIKYAFEGIALRGGPAGVRYLAEWVETDKHADRVRCHWLNMSPQRTARSIKEEALLALGFSTEKTAGQLLSAIKAKPPKDWMPDYIGTALERHEEIRAKGMRKAIEDQPAYRFLQQVRERRDGNQRRPGRVAPREQK